MINYIRIDSNEEIGSIIERLSESENCKDIQNVTDYVDDLESFFSSISHSSMNFWITLLKRHDFPEKLRTELISKIIVNMD